MVLAGRQQEREKRTEGRVPVSFTEHRRWSVTQVAQVTHIFPQ